MDLLQKRQIHYFMKVVIALLPGILMLWFIRESLMLLHITTNRFLYKKYNQLFDMAYADNFILVRIIFSLQFGECLVCPFICVTYDKFFILLSQSVKLGKQNLCIKV